MRLFLDENLQQPSVTFLRELGYDVVGVYDQRLVSAVDEIIFAHAQKTERTLITYNGDFVDVRELAGVHHCGIIRLRISDQRLAHAHSILQSALAQLHTHDLRDALVTVTDRRIRIRHTFAA